MIYKYLLSVNNDLKLQITINNDTKEKGHIRRCGLELVVKEGLEPSTPGL